VVAYGLNAAEEIVTSSARLAESSIRAYRRRRLATRCASTGKKFRDIADEVGVPLRRHGALPGLVAAKLYPISVGIAIS
jgi:hypothetical protein